MRPFQRGGGAFESLLVLLASLILEVSKFFDSCDNNFDFFEFDADRNADPGGFNPGSLICNAYISGLIDDSLLNKFDDLFNFEESKF